MATAKKITACVAMLCEAFNRKPTAATFKAYEVVFADISDELMDAATSTALASTREFMPTPGQLRELAVTGGVGYAARAELAWVEFDRAVRIHGPDHSVSFADGLINATVRMLGDWIHCASLTGDDYGVWLRKNFLETYQRLCTGGASERLRAPLRGLLWKANATFPTERLAELSSVSTGQVIELDTEQPVLLPPSEDTAHIGGRPASLPMVEFKRA